MARKTTTRTTTRRTTRAAAPAAAEATHEEGSGLGFEGGIVLTTTLLLIGACVLVWLAGY